MKASFEKVEKNVALLEVEVPAERVDVALDKAFKKVVMTLNVPGFRKGKLPRAMFDKKFGVESLYNDALKILLQEAYEEALEDTGITPVDQPDVDIVTFEKGQAFVFKVKVVTKPEVELGSYKDLDVEYPSLDVTDEELDAELVKLQNRHAELIVTDEGSVEDGDIAIIDFEGFLEGVPFPGGKGEKHPLEIGSGSFIPGFEDQVIGMVKDEERDIVVTFPEDYQSEDLAGKEAVFKVKLHEMKRKVLPELDDEFAMDISEFETLDEFKVDLKSRLLLTKKANADREYESAIIAKVAANATVEIPEVMIEDEVNQMLKDFERRLATQRMNLELYYQFTGTDEQSLRTQIRENADQAVLNRLVLEAVATSEGIAATDEDIELEYEKVSLQHRKSLDEVRKIFSNKMNYDGLILDILVGKTIKHLVEINKLVKEEV